MYLAGNIIYFDPFYFKNGDKSKPKYFVVLSNDGSNTVIASLPTRTDSVPSFMELKHGCIDDTSINFNCYHFEKEIIICKNGFCFPISTFLYGYQIDEYEISMLNDVYKIDGVDFEIKGELTAEEYLNLIKCFSLSQSVKRKFKRKFDQILTKG